LVSVMEPISQKARGHWHHILTQLGVPESSLRSPNRKCPVCQESRDSFSFTDKGAGLFFCRKHGGGDGFRLLEQFHGWDFPRACKEVERVLGVPEKVRFVSRPDPARALRRVYKGSRPVEDGDPVHLYLRNRGIDLLPKSLRFHPSLPVAGTHYPAILALLKDVTGKAVTLHRTFIQDGDKAPVDTPRMMMTPTTTVTGACARLYPADDAVLLAEGLETTLSAMTLFSLPGWACISAHGLETVQLPEIIKTVLIAADHDLNHVGAKAAYVAAERLSREGRKVRVEIPAVPGFDWNDELNLRRGRLS
jgi:putative DNA primase/helicase